MQKIINQNLISYKTVLRTYNETTPDNKEILIRQKEIIITEISIQSPYKILNNFISFIRRNIWMNIAVNNYIV